MPVFFCFRQESAAYCEKQVRNHPARVPRVWSLPAVRRKCQKMSEKKQILNSIVAVARRMRRTPSLAQFVASARVPKCSIMRQFGRWNEAVRAAGLEPCRFYVRPGNNDLLKDWAEVVRKKGGLPS